MLGPQAKEGGRTLVEWSKHWTEGAEPVRGSAKGLLLEALGTAGEASDRRAAVVALLGGPEVAVESRGGAFAAANVTAPLTHGFQNCLRDPPVNGGQQPTIEPGLRKQC